MAKECINGLEGYNQEHFQEASSKAMKYGEQKQKQYNTIKSLGEKNENKTKEIIFKRMENFQELRENRPQFERVHMESQMEQ